LPTQLIRPPGRSGDTGVAIAAVLVLAGALVHTR